MVTFKLFSLLMGGCVAIVLLLLIRRSRIHSALFIWWISIISLMLVFTFFPGLIDIVGGYLGVSYPPILLSVAGLSVFLVKVLYMDIYITKNEARYKRLAQKMAVLETMLNEKNSSKDSSIEEDIKHPRNPR